LDQAIDGAKRYAEPEEGVIGETIAQIEAWRRVSS
jgi:hypothetical protein